MSCLLAKIIAADKKANLAIDFQRAQDNLIDQTGASNQKGLEYALEETVRNKYESLAFIKISFKKLGKYNELYGHEKTDDILQKTKKKLTELNKKQNLECQIYRVGADWVLLFSDVNRGDIKQLNKIQKETNAFCNVNVAGENIPIYLASTALMVSPQKNNLDSIYKIIDHLKPAKGKKNRDAVYKKHLNQENGQIEINKNIALLSNLKTNEMFLDVSDDYLLNYKKRVVELEMGASHKEVQENIIEEMRRKLSSEYENIEMIELLDYSVDYRVIGDRKTFLDDKTLIIPMINIYNKPVGALKLKFKDPCLSWNKGEEQESPLNGQSVFRLERRKKEYLKFGDTIMERINDLLESSDFKETINLLIDLRRYSPALSLLDQTGRSPFFGRSAEEFLEKINNPLLFNKQEEKMPEYQLINKLLEKDGFVIVKRGGEEFFIYFKSPTGSAIGLSFDYNKFSRHAISWGESAGDLYMERTAGLLRHYLSQEINLLRRTTSTLNQETTRAAFEQALAAVNERLIEFEVENLEQAIMDKQGRYIFAAKNNSGQTFLFAAKSPRELEKVIKQSGEKLKTNPVFDLTGRFTRRKLLEFNGFDLSEYNDLSTMDKKEYLIKVDLNKTLAVNPKAVYCLENGQLAGRADQQFLLGLSLAGGIVNIDETVAQAISYSEQLAEEEKGAINQQEVCNNSQCSSIKSGEKNESTKK